MAGAVANLTMLFPYASPASAQRWAPHHAHRERHVPKRSHHEWERKKRREAHTNGVVAGVVGAAVLGGVIAAVASSHKDKHRDDRSDYCRHRYGNYDPRTDSYRASDGRLYRCE